MVLNGEAAVEFNHVGVMEINVGGSPEDIMRVNC